LLPALLWAQTPEPAPETERPAPILTGNAGFFTNVNGGQAELVPSVTPVLLLPLRIAGWSKPELNSKANSNGQTQVAPTAEKWNKRSTICNWTT